MLVGPLDGRAAISDAAPAAFVLMTDPAHSASRPKWMLRRLFGLSAAETEMAVRLIQGDTPEQAAAALGVRISTARWHLSSLFRKTDTRRQAELVRLFLSLPALNVGSDDPK